MENVQNMYWAKKSDYTFNVLHIEERKNIDNTFFIKVSEYAGHVHNCGPVIPHIVQRTNTYKDITQELLSAFYDIDLKEYHQK